MKAINHQYDYVSLLFLSINRLDLVTTVFYGIFSLNRNSLEKMCLREETLLLKS